MPLSSTKTPSPSPSPSPSRTRTRRPPSSSSATYVNTFPPSWQSTFTTISIILVVIAGLVVIGTAIAAFQLYRRYRRNQRNRAKWEETQRTQHVQPYHHIPINYHPSAMEPSAPTWRPSVMNSQEADQSELWNDPVLIAARIPLDKIEVHALLARGSNGEVYRGTYKDQVVAIKKLLPAQRHNHQHIHAFLCEIRLMATLEHAHIVAFIGVGWQTMSKLCVVSELLAGGDLHSLLTEWHTTRLRGWDADKARIGMHTAVALAYLHSFNPPILHRDLKSTNILLTEDLSAKLTDFGISREFSDQTMTTAVGTSRWIAPEVLLGERYDEKADMFSFGVVLSELDSHQLPYAHANTNLSDSAIVQRVALGHLRIQLSDETPEALCTLAMSCVELDPAKRPTAAEALYQMQLILKTYQ